jgi:cysteine synthase A
VIVAAEAGMEPMVQRLLVAYGVQLSMVIDPHPTGGWVAARRQRVQELVARTPGAWWPNQYDNVDNATSYAQLAEELLDQFEHIDVLVCSVGTGGHSAGITRRLRREWPHLRLVGVDAVGSVIFGQPSNRGIMRGIGNSIFPRNVSYGLFDEVHWVNAGEAVHVCRELARTGYVTGGWSVGCVALVASWLAHVRSQEECVVAVFPDGPQRYWNTVFDDEFCREHGLLGVEPDNQPDEIGHPCERQVTRWTRCDVIINPSTDDFCG